MYGGFHGYGMGPQSSYDQHSASPANAAAFGQNQQTSMRSASGMSAGLGNLDDYGRSSAQSGGHQQSGAFGSMNDGFPRSTSGFGGPSAYGQQSMAQQDDSLKPFADSKGGPSPALGQPGGRPGSAANGAGGSAQSGLPPPQGQHLPSPHALQLGPPDPIARFNSNPADRGFFNPMPPDRFSPDSGRRDSVTSRGDPTPQGPYSEGRASTTPRTERS